MGTRCQSMLMVESGPQRRVMRQRVGQTSWWLAAPSSRRRGRPLWAGRFERFESRRPARVAIGLGALAGRAAAAGAHQDALCGRSNGNDGWLKVGAEASVSTDTVHSDRLGVESRDRVLAAEGAEASHVYSPYVVGLPVGHARRSCRIVAGASEALPRLGKGREPI